MSFCFFEILIYQFFYNQYQNIFHSSFMKSKNIDKLILSRSVNGKKLNLEKRQSVVALPGIALSLLINKNSERRKSDFQNKNSTSYIKKEKLSTLTPILMRNSAQNFKISNIKRNVQRIKCVSSLKNYKINLKAENQYQNYKFKTNQSQEQISTNSQATLKSKQQKQYIENKSTCNIDQFRPFQEINFYNNRPEQITISQKNNKKNIFFENQQYNLKSSSIEKKYQSIGISTDPQFNNESYKEFIKFKLTQKQKFSKLQQIFEFIEDISVKQFPIINERYKKVKKLYEESKETERQKRTIQLKKQVKECQSKFENKLQIFCKSIISFQNQVLQKNFAQINRIMNLVVKISKQNDSQNIQKNQIKNGKLGYKLNEVDSQIDLLQRQIRQKNVNKSIYQNNRNYKLQDIVFNSNSSKYNSTQFMHQTVITNIECAKFRIKQQMEEQVIKRFNQLQKCSKKWSQAQSQKDYLIKICVQDIIKLPQLSLSIFGMSSNEGAIEQMSALQKIGIMLNQIEQFGTLCNPKSKSKFISKNENVDIDQFFRNIMSVKCLNCSYLKSKMKFIYNKNSQLQTTLKVINKLVDIQKRN